MDRDLLERMIGEGRSLEEIGRSVGRSPSTVSYWLNKYGLTAVHRERHLSRGGISEHALRELVDLGHTIAEMALTLEVSKTTVRHWLRRYGLRTRNSVGRRANSTVRARDSDAPAMLPMSCPRHGLADFVWEARGYYRCRRCRAEAVARRRRKVKAILVAEAGGECRRCGHQTSMRALHFHHLRPTEKRLEINAKGVSLALDTLRVEAQKCVLLCSNCHAEVEDGAAVVPVARGSPAFG